MFVHRTEIVNGPGRWRSWSTALKEQLVSETLEPGVTVTEVARRHDIVRSLLYRWRFAVGVRHNHGPGTFLPVEVTAETKTADRLSPDDATAAALAKGRGLMEIDLGPDLCVRVDAEVDGDALARVLAVLERR
ncbi:IS66-like element accessory protein TnpA [Oricola cellulosilytica]|uniref:Transposase n=1 Tax=Oricola cellulosilytica TaxID=1429082 RepID=A0A4V2MN37_9HYPH|nr:transposase [Oricola cellulosilytica]TCD11310.1 IS66 family insertion sequence hypothetical protein [Oricola cellulosilytica]